MANTEDLQGRLDALIERWWMMVLRGTAAIVAGVGAFAVPRSSLFAFVLLFGVYASINGLFALLHPLRGSRGGASQWGWFIFEGIVGSAVGVLALIYPGLTFLGLVALIATWALWTAVAQIAAALRLRRLLRNEWLLGASGLLTSVLAAVLVFVRIANVAALAWLFAAYALLSGVLLIALGLRLHSARRHVPGDRTPTPA